MNPSAINAPFYSQRRIGTLQALSKALNLSVSELQQLANGSNSLYRENPIAKPDGGIRMTYDALAPLKQIHEKIKTKILHHVIYPPYLTGSVKGCDYKVNASLHTKAKIVINEDVSGFFPSTSAAHVFNIWRNFFGFGDEVAQCLTQLTTRHGELPQGARTSSFLANLVFWKEESTLYEMFKNHGLVYSRYVDDIAVSSKKFLTDAKKTEIIGRIFGMLRKHGYEPKRPKHEIATSGNRMEVTKLAINSKPGLGKKTRGKIRAAVHHIEQRIANGDKLSFERGFYTQAMGLVLHLERFHPGKAVPLKERLLSLASFPLGKMRSAPPQKQSRLLNPRPES
jgi:hypothetical protein